MTNNDDNVPSAPAAPSGPFADTPWLANIRGLSRTSVLGRPYDVLPDGTRLGSSGKLLKDQDTPTTRAIRAVERTKAFPPRPERPAYGAPIVAPAASPVRAVDAPRSFKSAPRGGRFDNLEGPRKLEGIEVRLACEGLDLAIASLERAIERMEEESEDELAPAVQIMTDRVDSLKGLLAALMVNPPPAPVKLEERTLPPPLPVSKDPRWAKLRA